MTSARATPHSWATYTPINSPLSAQHPPCLQRCQYQRIKSTPMKKCGTVQRETTPGISSTSQRTSARVQRITQLFFLLFTYLSISSRLLTVPLCLYVPPFLSAPKIRFAVTNDTVLRHTCAFNFFFHSLQTPGIIENCRHGVKN